MHPPAFSIHDRLSDWPDCRLELHCPTKGGSTDYPVKLLILRHGDRPFAGALAKLRCKCCGEKPASVYLVAGLMRRADMGGEGASWAVMLVGENRPVCSIFRWLAR